MKRRDFWTDREDRWARLEQVLWRLESHSAKKLTQEELDEFVELYRFACSDLARVQSDGLGENIESYLNTIIARGHKQLRAPSRPKQRVVTSFITREFPRAVRAMKWYVLVAAILFIGPMVLSVAAVAADPTAAYLLTSPESLEMLTEAYAEGHKGGRSESEDTLMAGYYINHNVGIAFQCFATGIFFGLGSVFALLFNGAAIGAVGAYIVGAGYGDSFLSFVVGHGSFELTAIVLAGATGMRLGMLLVNPGPYTRMGAFRVHRREIMNVVFGAAVMLTVAAFIEGFWSPSGAPSSVKYIVGAFLWVLVVSYLVLAGRRRTFADLAEDDWGRP